MTQEVQNVTVNGNTYAVKDLTPEAIARIQEMIEVDNMLRAGAKTLENLQRQQQLLTYSREVVFSHLENELKNIPVLVETQSAEGASE